MAYLNTVIVKLLSPDDNLDILTIFEAYALRIPSYIKAEWVSNKILSGTPFVTSKFGVLIIKLYMRSCSPKRRVFEN